MQASMPKEVILAFSATTNSTDIQFGTQLNQ